MTAKVMMDEWRTDDWEQFLGLRVDLAQWVLKK